MTRTPFASFSRRQGGFSLLEVLLALGVSLALGSLAIQGIVRQSENTLTRAVGQEMSTVGGSLNTYVALHYNDIVNLTDVVGVGTSADPGPRDCDTTTSICTVTTDTLRRSGLLPPNFSGRNPYGAEYEYYIRVGGAAPNWIVDGFAIADQPFTNGGANPRYDLLGQSMLEAGADAAMTRSQADRLEGLNGAWSEEGFPAVNADGDTAIDQLGLLAYRVGYGSSAFSAFLRRDGSTAMTGNLDLGGNDINNIQDVNAEGSISGEQLVVRSPSASMLVLDESTDGTVIGTTAGRMFIRNNTGVLLETPDGTGRTQISAGDADFDGLVDVDGNINSSGTVTGENISSTSDGDVTSGRDLSVARNMQVGGTSFMAGDVDMGGALSLTGATAGITVNGIVTAENVETQRLRVTSGGVAQIELCAANQIEDCTASNTGGWFIASGAPNVMRAVNGKDVLTPGTLTGGQIRSTGNIVANGVIQITGAGPVGGACTLNGSIGYDSGAGTLTQCSGGSWLRLGVRGNYRAVGNLVSCGGSTGCPIGMTNPPTSTAGCNAATHKMSGGGYAMVGFSPINPPCLTAGSDTFCPDAHRNSVAPDRSYPDVTNQSWTVTVGHMNGNSSFQAYAVCIQ